MFCALMAQKSLTCAGGGDTFCAARGVQWRGSCRDAEVVLAMAGVRRAGRHRGPAFAWGQPAREAQRANAAFVVGDNFSNDATGSGPDDQSVTIAGGEKDRFDYAAVPQNNSVHKSTSPWRRSRPRASRPRRPQE